MAQDHELEALRQLVEEQARRIDALERRAAASPPDGPPDESADEQVDRQLGTAVDAGRPPVDEVRDRRSVLRGAGLAATAAGAATAATLLGASPAAAANGDPIAAGSTTGATSATSLLYTGGAVGTDALFSVSDTTVSPTGGPAAIWGLATSRVFVGVHGKASISNGIGVLGTAQTNGGVGVRARGNRAAVQLESSLGSAPPSRVDIHSAGELDIDSSGDTWLCVTSGTPGSWRKVGGPTTAGSFHVLGTPSRVYDSRPGLTPTDVVKGTINPLQERVIDARHDSPVPAGATAAMVNLTVTNTNSAGFLALFRNGIAWPGTSSLNWSSANLTTANLAVVALDTTGRFTVRCDGGGVTNFVIDVIGYYR